MKKSGYFEAVRLSPHWFAHVLWNIVRDPSAYLRELHDLLAENDAGSTLCDPFRKWSNLHIFIEDVFESIINEPTEDGRSMRREFLERIDAPKDWFEDLDDEGLGEIVWTQEYERGKDNFVEEIFHILFHDLNFLQNFNSMIARYIEDYGSKNSLQDPRFASPHALQRVSVPSYVKDAVYFRDSGECRDCKKSIDRIISPEARERYDHIIPLARSGANDITNIQLLCETCNIQKSDKFRQTSKLYARVYKLES